MRALIPVALLAGLLLPSAPAHASPDQPEQVPIVDVGTRRDALLVLRDDDGNVVLIDRDAPDERTFYGREWQYYQLQVYSTSSDGNTAFDVTALDFRAQDRRTSVSLRDGAYTMTCQGQSRALKPVTDKAQRDALLKGATFHSYRWRRNAVGLYRDEYGVYYFIDRATGDDEDADHRVHIGWRGQILRAPMTLVASDSLGRVYAAANGTRRLVLTRGEVRYVEGATERVLYELDLVRDGPFIYGPLGVYGSAPHGTPCDVWLGK